MRIIAMFRSEKSLGGRCPSCELPFDAVRCQLLSHQRTSRAVRRRTGIAVIFTVDCYGTPSAPVGECPCCAQGHPGHGCEPPST
jgi:hypothetical protein